jgi:LmbE family N-acetylglucosaminyl deacetylase
MPHRIAIAIAAHPDDIEFYMAGTLLLLKEAGYQTHYLNLASGNCGSLKYNAAATRSIRNAEARAAAKILEAQFHPSLTDDLEILYTLDLLRALAAIVRGIHPAIILTHSPQDYMEDHTNTCRLAVTAAFARGMPNFKTIPAHPPIEREVTIYHAMPHGLRDQLRQRIIPDAFVDTCSVHKVKRKALACHKSQQPWLESSQGLDAYLLTMEAMSLEMGRLSKQFKHAEGWRRHLHLGFCSPEADPLRRALQKKFLLNPAADPFLDNGD